MRNEIRKQNGMTLSKESKNGETWFIMSGGKFGNHGIYESELNERVIAHWNGYIQNSKIVEKSNSSKRCSECKLGEHENYDNNVRLCKVYDEGRYVKRINICATHQEAYFDNGYELR